MSKPTIGLNDPALYGNKYHFEYDEVGKVIAQYSCSYQTNNNEPCWKRVYSYSGDNLIGAHDVYDVWNSDWDI